MTEPRGADAGRARLPGGAVPRRGPAATSTRATAPRPGQPDEPPTTVLPSGTGGTSVPGASVPSAPASGAPASGTPVPGSLGTASTRPTPARTVPPRPVSRADLRPPSSRSTLTAGRSRRARLSLRRIDPWSVFVFTLVASIFVGIALVVAVAALFTVLQSIGVTGSVNELFSEVTGGLAEGGPLITFGRVVGGAAVLAALNIVFLTLLATLSALLYNLCASFTGGIELTLGEDD